VIWGFGDFQNTQELRFFKTFSPHASPLSPQTPPILRKELKPKGWKVAGSDFNSGFILSREVDTDRAHVVTTYNVGISGFPALSPYQQPPRPLQEFCVEPRGSQQEAWCYDVNPYNWCSLPVLISQSARARQAGYSEESSVFLSPCGSSVFDKALLREQLDDLTRELRIVFN
jgi:hypothetical protein